MSAPPNESLLGGQAMTGALTDPSVNPDSALLRPATVIYTLGRGSASYWRRMLNACSGVLCADPIRVTTSNPKPRAASAILAQCASSDFEPIKMITSG